MYVLIFPVTNELGSWKKHTKYLLFQHFLSTFWTRLRLRYVIIFTFTGICTIKRRMVKKSYPTWGPSYKVSFSLKINKLPRNRSTNIIHVTKGGNWHKLGDRIPFIGLQKVGRNGVYLLVCSGIYRRFKYRSSNGRYRYYARNYRNFCTKTMVSLGKKYDITVQQSKKSGKYWYQIFISGEKTRSFVIWKPRKFTNVKCYTSDPWYPPFTSDLGTVSNLKIENQTATKTRPLLGSTRPKTSSKFNV